MEKLTKEEMLKELRKIELERIEMDMYGGSREESPSIAMNINAINSILPEFAHSITRG